LLGCDPSPADDIVWKRGAEPPVAAGGFTKDGEMVRRVATCVAVVVLAACGMAPAAKRVRPSAAGDAWLGRLALKWLDDAVAKGEYATLAENVEKLIQARSVCTGLSDLATINDLVYAHRAAKVLPAAAKIGKADFATYLARRRGLLRLMLRAIGDTPSAEKAVAKLHDLYTADAKRVAAWPNLAVAFATSADRYDRFTPAGSRTSLRASFAFYTSNRRFAYDLQRLPYELSRYLTDTRLSLEERQWARDTYAQAANPARSYFDVKYDRDYSRRGKAKKISGHPYTLWNLRQYGGVCRDQAYFAAHVCKALGIPATIVSGRSRGGVGHAWVARLVLTDGGRSARWDAGTARYRSHLYYTGLVTDPAAGRDMLDSELILTGYAALQPLQEKEEADAALYVARYLHDNRKADWAANVALLKVAAADYNTRARAGDDKAADLSWARIDTKTKARIVEEFLAAALRRNLALGQGWTFLVELRKADAIPLRDLDAFLDILIDRTARAFPAYSCRIVLDLATTVPSGPGRLATYGNCLRRYGSHPDLAGQILIATGNEYAHQGRDDLALKAYIQAADKAVKVPEVVLAATDRAAKLLVDSNQASRAVAMYQSLIGRIKPSGDPLFFHETVYYQLHARLAGLYRQMGRHSSAARIMSRLNRR